MSWNWLGWAIAGLSLLYNCFQGTRNKQKEDTGITTELSCKIDNLTTLVEKMNIKIDDSTSDIKDHEKRIVVLETLWGELSGKLKS